MSTALDEVLDNRAAQEFWARRFIALIIDYIILWLPITAISMLVIRVSIFSQGTWLLSGFLVLVYSAFFEAEFGYTIGKRVMNLEVVSLDGRAYDVPRGLVRNLSKIYWVFLLIDALAGILAENRVNMRYLDIVGNCEVVDTQVATVRREQGLTPPVAGATAKPAQPVTVQSDADVEPSMPPEPSAKGEAMPSKPVPPKPVPPPPVEMAELVEDETVVEELEDGDEMEEVAPIVAPPAYAMPPPVRPEVVEEPVEVPGETPDDGSFELVEAIPTKPPAKGPGGWEAMEEDGKED